MSAGAARTHTTTGRLVRHCKHAAGWDSRGGADRCRACGTRRFTEYRAVRPPGPLPPGPPPPEVVRTRKGAG
ncbi:DUF6255 family natural product biosynthesis protein [Streptomyces mobaraensis]|uniref:DUF6255 family natural product biosynthesis protein n=1 Tax=Streptomyces mobaraensis TaxID=35621 RepID=UPI003B9678AA